MEEKSRNPIAPGDVLECSRAALRGVVGEGDVVVDATAGNGHDTAFLAGLVGDRGVVHALDVQERALASTRRRLEELGLLGRVELHLEDHGRLAAALPDALRGRVAAVMFNLGYLPGSDKRLTTRTGSTLRALNAALELLAPGGLLSVVCYTGHPGGAEEAAAVEQWSRGLDFSSRRATRVEIVNKPGHSVILYLMGPAPGPV